MPDYLQTAQGRRIAYHYTPGKGPGLVFLGGYRSDMQGTKAVWLEDRARAMGRAFLRFDYSGHGQSSGAFEDGAIGDWAEDAAEAISRLTSGPQILIGSSMGGWISLLMARAMPERIQGLVGIAAAPDFTQAIWNQQLTQAQRDEVTAKGRIEIPSAYADFPYIFTRRLFEDGTQQQIFDRPLSLPFPTRLLQGSADADVPVSVALRILDHATGPDIRLNLVKDADHRFSTPDNLALIGAAVDDILARI